MYVQRYAGGFVNGDNARQADATLFNNIETALLALFGVVPLTNGSLIWDGTKFTAANKIVNTNIDAAAAIDKSKLAALAIVDADVAGGAAIAGSKLGSNIAPSKLSAYPADATKMLRGDGTWVKSHQKIEEQILGASAASVTFPSGGGSIPQTFRSLELHVEVRNDAIGSLQNLLMRFNGDTAGNYDWQSNTGQGTVVTAGEAFGSSSAVVGFVIGSSSGAGHWGIADILIPNYVPFFHERMFESHAFAKWGTTTGSMIRSSLGGSWRSGSAITSITLLPASGNFVANSTFTLYGVV